ncbi:hypothetical protein [Chitinophaga rhizophila]|uniref:Uncharacterized protein n=1 Tax=Chitinophaga rhizophila TaxID=2866212 RepID=A0ABS7GIC4_9BACT|nr:hypothetical protein [Chitinophaga rhizophila]MBW8687445.1 hypothetical protein [Chitinophaga rhizophila]
MKMNRVTYYSLYIDGDELCEVEKFVTRFNKPDYATDYDNIMAAIREMGMTRGADARYFPRERFPEALSPPYASGELRLYCSRITKEIVILGNGCMKTSLKAQYMEECLFHFELIRAVSEQITARITAGALKISNRRLEGDLAFKIGDCYE